MPTFKCEGAWKAYIVCEVCSVKERGRDGSDVIMSAETGNVNECTLSFALVKFASLIPLE